MFVAFTLKEYKYFFVVNGISMIGTWMQRLAMSWLVYRITESATWLGVVNFAGWFTAFLVMPWAGVFLDTFSRRKLLAFAQIIGFLQAIALAVLTFSGNIEVWQIMALSVGLGVVNGFDMPGRHAFVSDLVTEKKYLANAIALNSTMFNLARLVGPAFAGVIVAKAGEGLCFLINGLSFLPAAIFLIFLKLEEEKNDHKGGSFVTGIVEGLKYARNHEAIFPVLLMLSVASFMGMSIVTLLPVVAKEVLSGDSQTLGFLTGAMGLGAVFGALWLASRSSAVGMEKIINVAFGSYGFFAICLSWSTSLPLSLLFMSFLGFCVVNGWSSSNTVLQTVSDKARRSRVMSIYLMCFSGMAPVGSLIMGWLTSKIGVSLTISTGGCLLLIASFFFSFKLEKLNKALVRACN
jgi:MFS family permease